MKGLRRQQDYTIHQHTSDKKRENGRWEGQKNSAKVRICGGNGNESEEGRIFLLLCEGLYLAAHRPQKTAKRGEADITASRLQSPCLSCFELASSLSNSSLKLL